jgi:primosomal protein N' (replication factor Y)
MTVARVALDVPMAQLFDYQFDAAQDPAVGERVLVPFGKRHLVGVVVELAPNSDLAPARLKNISRVLRDAPPFSAEDLRLLRFGADYYHHPLGQVVMNALPQRLRRATGRELRELSYEITSAGSEADIDALPARATAKRSVLSALKTQRVLTPAELRSIAPSAPAAVPALVQRGWVTR